MAIELRGRSALLKKKIERLELQETALRSSMPEFQDPTLKELRRELEQELAAKRVVLFGTSHDIQKNGNQKNTAFEERLSFLTDRFAVTILMEEWAADCPPSFASSFVGRAGISYENVGTPADEQFRTFVNATINHPGHDGTLGRCEDAPPFYEYGPLTKQENRELRMAQNVLSAMQRHNVGLFIFGLAHLHSISSKLQAAGFNIAAYFWLG